MTAGPGTDKMAVLTLVDITSIPVAEVVRCTAARLISSKSFAFAKVTLTVILGCVRDVVIQTSILFAVNTVTLSASLLSVVFKDLQILFASANLSRTGSTLLKTDGFYSFKSCHG